MARWAMAIDMRKCIGCGSCVEICSQVNNVPYESAWRNLIERTLINRGKLSRFFLTMSCMHCDNPPCLEVCPTKATFQTNDGIVDIIEELCVGCGACILACPYRARSINHIARIHCYEKVNDPSSRTRIEDRIGICRKCNFCLPIIESGLKNNLQPGKDPDATPLCVQHCPSEALSFGNLDDPTSPLSHILSQNKTIRILEELGTNPAVYYIPDIRED
jgi:phenylacetyl-CoA:acceptor oxidoreductase 27-kDa subunit